MTQTDAPKDETPEADGSAKTRAAAVKAARQPLGLSKGKRLAIGLFCVFFGLFGLKFAQFYAGFQDSHQLGKLVDPVAEILTAIKAPDQDPTEVLKSHFTDDPPAHPLFGEVTLDPPENVVGIKDPEAEEGEFSLDLASGYWMLRLTRVDANICRELLSSLRSGEAPLTRVAAETMWDVADRDATNEQARLNTLALWLQVTTQPADDPDLCAGNGPYQVMLIP